MIRKRFFIHAFGAALILSISYPALATTGCEGLLPQNEVSATTAPVTPEMLASLRDVGPTYLVQTDRPILTLSPDRRSVAFEIHQADPERNSYCVGLAVLDLKPGSRPRLVDFGGDLIIDPHPSKGFTSLESGAPLPITPHWAPDGKALYFLKRSHGRTQVWRADLIGGPARQVTRSAVDVEDFRLAPDGQSLVYASRPGLIALAEAIDREGMRGWRHDDRVLPPRGARPHGPNADTAFMAIELPNGDERSASAEEAGLMGRPAGIPASAPAFALARSGRPAWVETAGSDVYPPPYRIVARSPAGKMATCEAKDCKPYGGTRLWWSDDGKILRFTRLEGWAGDLTAIYEWKPGRRKPRKVYQTGDALIDCRPLGRDLVCLREKSNLPRHIVRLTPGSARETILFQTNPEIANARLGRVERQHWRNAFGVPFYGDLIYPTDYAPGTRFPLVVVQYRSRGFLRGGVGDEMPIQAFSNRGYFILVLDIGESETVVGPRKTFFDQQHAAYRDMLRPRHLLSALETRIGALIDEGLVDRRRVGISGLSAGARITQYAAMNSSLFSAGSLGTCCEEPDQDAFMGPSIAANNHRNGWPRLIEPSSSFWSSISIMARPREVRFPLLLQMADTEHLIALSGFTAMTQANVPTDLYVFPDEFHVKWQPAHRLAVYRRNLAWFDFWLKGVFPQLPVERAEALRWSEMRGRWQGARSAGP